MKNAPANPRRKQMENKDFAAKAIETAPKDSKELTDQQLEEVAGGFTLAICLAQKSSINDSTVS